MLEWIPLAEWRRLPAVSGLYLVRNKVNGKEYVGKSLNVRQRVRVHLRAKNAYRFHSQIRLYGDACFEVCLYMEGSETEMLAAEVRVIAERNTYRNGYNSTLGGEGSSGAKWSERSREARRLQATGRKHSPETKKALSDLRLVQNPMKGYRWTDEQRAKLSAVRSRAPRSAEVKLKISQALSGKSRLSGAQFGEKNAMHGRTGGKCPKAKAVLVWTRDALTPQTFDCVGDAARFFGVRPQTVSSRCSGVQNARGGLVFAYA